MHTYTAFGCSTSPNCFDIELVGINDFNMVFKSNSLDKSNKKKPNK